MKFMSGYVPSIHNAAGMRAGGKGVWTSGMSHRAGILETRRALAPGKEYAVVEGIRMVGSVGAVTEGTAGKAGDSVAAPPRPGPHALHEPRQRAFGLLPGGRDAAAGRVCGPGRFGCRAGADPQQAAQAGGGKARADESHRQVLCGGPAGGFAASPGMGWCLSPFRRQRGGPLAADIELGPGPATSVMLSADESHRGRAAHETCCAQRPARRRGGDHHRCRHRPCAGRDGAVIAAAITNEAVTELGFAFGQAAALANASELMGR